MLGNKTVTDMPGKELQDKSSVYIFAPSKFGATKDEIIDEKTQMTIMNVLSLFDLIFGFFGILMSFLNPWLFFASIPMLFADAFAIWIVSV